MLNSRVHTCIRLSRAIAVAVGMMTGVIGNTVAHSQEYPAFTQPATIPDRSINVEGGVSAVSVPNGLYGTVLMSVYVNPQSGINALGYTISGNGTNALYSTAEPYAVPSIYVNGGIPSTAAAAIRMFNGTIYIAYADASTQALDVVTATPISGNVGYSFALVYSDSSTPMVTSPEMEVVNGKLVIVYGSSANPNVKNAFFSVTYDGTTFTAPSEQYLGGSSITVASAAKPGMALLNGVLWMCIQQNYSSHQLFTYYTTDGVVWQFGTQFQGLALGGGASMITYEGALVLATQQNNSNRSLFIFSSVDGYNWGAKQCSGIQMGQTPGIALFNNGVSLAFKSNNSANYFTSFGY